jgi:hypothetical protein
MPFLRVYRLVSIAVVSCMLAFTTSIEVAASSYEECKRECQKKADKCNKACGAKDHDCFIKCARAARKCVKACKKEN